MCPLTPDTQLHLAATTHAASDARRFLRRGACPVHAAEVLEDSALLVTELVANAVRHGGPPVVLRLHCDASGGLQVAVSDGSPQPPVQRQAGVYEECGRGVALVDMISDDWGVDPDAGGKTVWFRLRS